MVGFAAIRTDMRADHVVYVEIDAGLLHPTGSEARINLSVGHDHGAFLDTHGLGAGLDGCEHGARAGSARADNDDVALHGFCNVFNWLRLVAPAF